MIAIYVLLSFVERLKHRKVKIFTDNQGAARELSFGGFKVLQSVALSTFHDCFCMVLPWKCSGFLDCSTGRLIFCAVLFDKDDSHANPSVFRVVEAKWGPPFHILLQRTQLPRFDT